MLLMIALPQRRPPRVKSPVSTGARAEPLRLACIAKGPLTFRLGSSAAGSPAGIWSVKSSSFLFGIFLFNRIYLFFSITKLKRATFLKKYSVIVF